MRYQVNQKNYYTEYLKRDDQLLALRLNRQSEAETRLNKLVKQARDKDREQVPESLRQAAEGDAEAAEEDVEMDRADKGLDARTIVIHPGSQNLRIGLASQILPKTVPMVVARKAEKAESEEDGGEPSPKRRKLENNGDKLLDDDVSQGRISYHEEIRY